MFEGRCHAVDLRLRQSKPRRVIAPRRYSAADRSRHGARARLIKLEVGRDFHRKRQGCSCVILVDRRRENPRLEIDRHRIQVIGRREAPPAPERSARGFRAKRRRIRMSRSHGPACTTPQTSRQVLDAVEIDVDKNRAIHQALSSGLFVFLGRGVLMRCGKRSSWSCKPVTSFLTSARSARGSSIPTMRRPILNAGRHGRN